MEPIGFLHLLEPGGSIRIERLQEEIIVEVHATEEARKAGWPSVAQHAHYIGMESLQGDLIPAIYAVLKTLTPYAGAEDI
jgi:hypothetical protein